MLKVSRNALAQLAIFVSISIIWLIIGWVLRSVLIPNSITLEDEVKRIILRESPGEIPSEEELSFAAARGMLELLNDPFAVIVPPPTSLKFDDDFAGNTGIVGLVPNVNDAGELYIETVIADGPGDRAGVQVGDILLSIDGIPVDATTTVTGSALLFRGPVGESAELVVRRGEAILKFAPIRIERVALEWAILENGVGYIAQYTFTTNVPQLFNEALTEIMAVNPRAIIWDVRYNGGGSMLVAQEVLSNFIAEGDLFQVVLKDSNVQVFSATGAAVAPDVPLYVLVNEFTFSAAETVASTIQERGRGTTLGTPTFGKGTIQNAVKLRDDYLFEYTIGNWLTPAGVSYQDVGFVPMVRAPDDPTTAVDETLEAVFELLNATN